MARLLHFSDTHLGHQQYHRTNEDGLNQREADLYQAFDAVIQAALDDPPDVVIHAGDLFDGVRPSNRALHKALDGFRRLGQAGIPVVAIAGNHEQPRLRETGSAFRLFEHLDNVHPVYRGRAESILLPGVAVHAVPQCASNDALREQVASIERIPDVANVLVVHGAIHALPAFRHAEFNELTLFPEWFDERFEYVALGHYHGTKEVTPKAWYSGAPERVSMAEAGEAKGYLDVVVDPGEHPQVQVHHVPGRDYVDLPVIRAKGLDAEAVQDAATQAVERVSAGAVGRQRITDLDPSLRGLLDVRAIQQAGRGLVHFDLRLEWADLDHRVQGAVDLAGLEEEFEAFAAKQPVEGLDRARLLEMARSVLGDAA